MIKKIIKKVMNPNLLNLWKDRFNLIKSIFQKPIYNFFKKNNLKTVLLSNLRRPFTEGIKLVHTQYLECYYAAQIFDELGYNVDIADYDYIGSIDYSRYHVIYGFGWPLANRFLNNTPQNIISIHYATGMEDSYNNYKSLERIKDVYRKKNKYFLSSARLTRNLFTEQLVLVNAIISLGNFVAADTYKKNFDNVYSIPSFFYKTIDFNQILEQKKFSDAKKKFLWFGSCGLIHKGLDLLLEVFTVRKDVDLYICGPIDNETEFVKCYYNELYNTENIHCYGFVDLNSKKYFEILSLCAFCIFPTCAEGGSPSVITNMGNGGLIPVVTKEATIDSDNFGVLINDLTAKAVNHAIDICVNLPDNEIKEKSRLSGECANNNYSAENYYINLKKIISEILKLGE